MSRLTFTASADLRKIFKHTLDAESWSNPYGIMPEMVDQMHILFVKDSGIYLMSGNAERLMRDGAKGSVVVYARGYNPKTNTECWDDARDAVGGDDFAEPLPVDSQLIQAVLDGGSFFVDVKGERISYGATIMQVSA